ncbi:MAG: metallophosphoesterase [Scytolyngbya sp. HA4215-MV1]|nr:metallophosphoesterase [Scytolyngbya sp. HA4215-MV1]
MPSKPELLTDPFLQLPTQTSVQVVWFTEFAGDRHTVAYGSDLQQVEIAQTQKLSRTREDARSKVLPPVQQVVDRPIWRHEATIGGLSPGVRLPYQVTSVREDGESASSLVFTLAAQPTPGMPLKILLTSDHQLKPMVTANLQKVVETVGQVDAVFFAGDLVNVADRASEWFDDSRGGAFFPALQGRANYQLEPSGIRYVGGELIQHAPLFATVGNHEVMGRFSSETSLDEQFYDAVPRSLAQEQYDYNHSHINPDNSLEVEQSWLKNQSFNIDTYEEILTLPRSLEGGEKYYAVTFGDICLVVLYITCIWRTPSLNEDARGKYRERDRDLDQPGNWGYGQLIFEPIAKNSLQYTWLAQELQSQAFQQAKYKIVMFHHPPHSLGENIEPAYTNPVPVIERNLQGDITAIRYEYPKRDDYIIRDVVPLLEEAGVQFVFYGHSHLWNRFMSPTGMHFLESSNVGNSYGAYVGDLKRHVPRDYQEDYAATGNPNGLPPVVPTIAPLTDARGNPLPYIASNELTAFSIFDTASGMVSSYRFDTRQPESAVVKFDEFLLNRGDGR